MRTFTVHDLSVDVAALSVSHAEGAYESTYVAPIGQKKTR